MDNEVDDGRDNEVELDTELVVAVMKVLTSDTSLVFVSIAG